MVAAVKSQDGDLKIKFGGGLRTRASTDEIDPREAAEGQNFILDLDNRELRPRKPFDLIGTLPNNGEVRGGASLRKSDGTVTALFQGAGNVYQWDGATTFTLRGTCNASSKLRGHWRSNNWILGDKVLITDLALADTIKEWNGTAFSSSSFTNEAGSSFGSFSARYLYIANERAVWANVKDPSTATPHLIVGSQLSNYQVITVNQRPSSSLNDADPFYIPTPDLKPINGIESAFGTTVFSTEMGQMFNLSGESAKDFKIVDFFAGSYATGRESVRYIGNDIIYGRQGRIESVRDTASFGNSESDDLTRIISDQIEDFTDWTVVYNSRTNLVYLFSSLQSDLWVFNNAIRTERALGSGPTGQFVDTTQNNQLTKLSPWMRFTTDHALAFQPTFVMSMLDPADGLEYIFMGDSAGRIYRMEGTGSSGDGGTTDITTSWTSKLFAAPLDAEEFVVEGFIKYRKTDVDINLTLTFLWQGKNVFDKSIDIVIPSSSTLNYFGGNIFFGTPVYFGATFQARLVKRKFEMRGQESDFQVRIESSGVGSFNINEIGLRFGLASQ